ncbi:MAG: phosphate ABC transporter permease subunit PstC [Ignavibacteria bacterium]|nr:phosphate ABC transporter permease subunit PstC [Ignavibacteria bacterium]
MKLSNSIVPIRKKLTLPRRPGEFFIEAGIKTVSFTSFAVIILIFIFVFRETLPVFFPKEHKAVQSEVLESESYGDTAPSEHDKEIQNRIDMSQALETSGENGKITMESITAAEWQPVSAKPRYGLWPLFFGSLKVTLVAIAIASPLAILAALFSAVFAPKRSKELIKPVIELLAGFPSVVIGFFALMTIATISQNIFGYQYRLNSFVGGVALALAVIPIIYTVTEDAINSVPGYYFEAAYALGATKWQTALFVILPAVTPGIFAAMLLGFGRAFGETMIVLMATGNAALGSFSIFDPVRTFSATIGAEMAEVVFGDNHYTMLFLIGSLLFIVTFALNAVAEFWVRNKLLKRFRGE